MLPSDCPDGQIRVQQVGMQWHVLQRDAIVERFDGFDAAVSHALNVFKDRRSERLQILVLPPDSPFMLD